MSFLTKVEAADSITPDMLRMLRTDINIALKEVGDKHGVKLEAGSASYSTGTFTLKINGGLLKEDGSAVQKEAEDFKRYAKMFGLEPEDLGQKFKSNGKEYTISGLATRKSKYPILAKDAQGKTYKFPMYIVKLGLGRQLSPGEGMS